MTILDFGLVTATRLDIKRTLFGFEETILIGTDDEEKVELSSLCSNMKHFILDAKELCDESLNNIYSSYQENKKREFYFTEKWAAMESIIKLSGGGFYDIKRIKEILPKTVSKQNAVFCDGKIYILSNSIYK